VGRGAASAATAPTFDEGGKRRLFCESRAIVAACTRVSGPGRRSIPLAANERARAAQLSRHFTTRFPSSDAETFRDWEKSRRASARARAHVPTIDHRRGILSALHGAVRDRTKSVGKSPTNLNPSAFDVL
jgi:hypothetical protein